MTHSVSNFQPHENESLNEAATLAPGVTLVVIPPGNIANVSDCLRGAFVDADIITAEDTRRTRNLVTALGTSLERGFISNFDHSENSCIESLIQAVKAGQKVIVVTDAGMLMVSDPGLTVATAAHNADVPVSCVSGPSVVTTALTLSGLGVGRFRSDGSTPHKQGARRAWLESLKAEKRACCFSESSYRLAVTLTDTVEILDGEWRASVSRELTRRFEETRRITLGGLAAWVEEDVRGGITMVTEGVGQQATEVPTEGLIDRAEDLVADGIRPRNAAKQIAAEAGVTEYRDLYWAVLTAREGNRQTIVTLCQKMPQYTAVNRVNAIIGSSCNLGRNEENLRKPIS